MLRHPVVAGMFYDADAHALRKHMEKLLVQKEEKLNARAIIVPHAGYVYSGAVAGEVFSSVRMPDTFIIMGPNHTGAGAPVSVMNKGVWRTPLGDARINSPLADEIINNSDFAEADTAAHLQEHSIEVQLPFIQALRKSFTFVPITIGTDDEKVLKETACAIREAMRDKDILLVSSTDLTHYEGAKDAEKKDNMALKKIEEVDPEGLADTVNKNSISMCGWMPTYAALYAARLLGAEKGKIIRYTNSGEASGDFGRVVGYGGAAVL